MLPFSVCLRTKCRASSTKCRPCMRWPRASMVSSIWRRVSSIWARIAFGSAEGSGGGFMGMVDFAPGPALVVLEGRHGFTGHEILGAQGALRLGEHAPADQRDDRADDHEAEPLRDIG